MKMKATVGVYARYSDDSQSPMSVEDQMRRALDYLSRLGIEATKVVPFIDEDMSAYKLREAYARPAFNAMMAAWDAGAFDIVVTDEFSRLGRNPRQQLEILERLDSTPVRLICADGIDSANSGSRMALGIKGVMAQEESRGTSYRVKRGMVGQLRRGYMMAAPAYGYRAERHYESGRAIGTSWHIVQEEAKIVQRMYEMRRDGAAFDKIARWLNETGVPTPRDGRLWRAAGVQRMLSNSVYRGEVMWKEESLDPSSIHGKSTQQHFFDRQHLRIVTDELWHCGQSGKVSRSGYGGGRQAYSGILTCGHCSNLLSSTAKGKAFTCGSCNSNRLVGDPQVLAVPTISVAGLNAVLSFALERVLNDGRIEALRARLRERLAQGTDGELAELRKTRDQLVKVGQHLLRLIYQREQPDPLLDEEYAKNSKSVAYTERQIKALETTKVNVARRDIAAQLDVDPRALTEKLLDGKLPPEHLRAVLAKLFPRFVFLGRESRYIARFEIEFAPGAAVAWLSDSAPILDERVVIRVRLIGNARRPVVWNVIEESVEVGELVTTSELAETAHEMDEACAMPA